MSLGVPKWAGQYIQIPFEDKGYSEKGCHCWGLVWLVYKNELKIELNKYLEFCAGDVRKATEVFHKEAYIEPWVPVVGDRKDFDVMLLAGYDIQKARITRLSCHVGVVAGGHLLHVEKQIMYSACPAIAHQSINRRIIGTFRHSKLL